MNIPSVYINLDRRPDRKSHCQRILHSFENVTRVSAVDGGFVKYTTKDVFPYYDTRENRRWDKSIKLLRSIRMSPGEIGCALSHLNVWRSMETPLLILEDDILLVNNFQTRLKKNLLSLPDDWHILYLGYMNPRENGLAQFITPELCKAHFVFGTYAYLLNMQGRDILLSNLPIDRPVDNFIGSLCESNKLKAYAIHPPLISQLEYGGENADIVHTAHAKISIQHIRNNIF